MSRPAFLVLDTTNLGPVPCGSMLMLSAWSKTRVVTSPLECQLPTVIRSQVTAEPPQRAGADLASWISHDPVRLWLRQIDRCRLIGWTLLLAMVGVVVTASELTAADRSPGQLVPLPREAPAPADNPTNPAKVELGKTLFFDPRLSGDNQMSCASCHLPEKAYADGLTVSPGAGGQPLQRNTPSCLNVGFLEALFWDGRAADLEAQALGPLQSVVEMNQDLEELERELAEVPFYRTAFQQVFGTAPNRDGVAKALAAFQRTLISEPSAFDRYLMGDKQALTAEEKRGLELFQGDAGCVECHHGPLLSDGKYYRLGLASRDEGRAAVTGKRDDRFRIRTPSLRNVAETGPYMHDGSMDTLEEVVTFYFRGIPSTGPEGLLPDTTARTGQSFADIDAVVAFLRTLSGKVPDLQKPQLP